MSGTQSAVDAQPLEELRVIDASNLIAAPFGTSILSDFGADVITIEHPEYADAVRNLEPKKDDVSLWWKLLGRNKRSITLDLSKPQGAVIFKDLVAEADVVVESFRPGTMEKWGLGYEDLRSVNSDLIMLRLTGFGQSGPNSDKPGFGRLAGAFSGMTTLIGEADGPPIEPSFPIEDLIAGVFGAFGIMVSAFHRNTGGGGQVIDLSLYEPIFRLISINALEYQQLQEVPKRNGSQHPYIAPNSIFETDDGEYLMLPPSTEGTWKELCRAMDREDLIDDPRFERNQDRVEHATEITEIVGEWVGAHASDQIDSAFSEFDVPYQFVYDIEDVITDEHYQQRNNLISVSDPQLGEVTVPNVVPKLSETPGRVENLGSEIGAANTDVYREECGYSKEQLREWEENGVI